MGKLSSFLLCLSFADEAKTEQRRPSINFIIKSLTFQPTNCSHRVFPSTCLNLLAKEKNRILSSRKLCMVCTVTHRIPPRAILRYEQILQLQFIDLSFQQDCEASGADRNRGTNNVTTPHKLLPTRNWPVTLLLWDLSHICDRALRALEEILSLRDQFKNFPAIKCWGKDNKKRKAKVWIRALCHHRGPEKMAIFHVSGLPLPGITSLFLLFHMHYQIRHLLSGFIGDPLGHWKLLEKSWLLLTGPETRSGKGLCGSVFREDWSFSGSWCPHIAWRAAKQKSQFGWKSSCEQDLVLLMPLHMSEGAGINKETCIRG